jgi:hypothetical protein
MKWPWLRFPLTSIGLASAGVVVAGALVGDIHIITLPAGIGARIGRGEIDTIVSMWVLVGAAFLVDQAIFTRRINQMARLHVERQRVVRLTMRGLQDVVSNCVTQLQLLRQDAEGHVPEESLALFDEAVAQTLTDLTVLKDVQAFADKHMFVGAGEELSRRLAD